MAAFLALVSEATQENENLPGRCNREKPPCKYFHPPQHLKDQLLINGRNHLALKNALMQQIPLQPMIGQLPTVAATHPYVTSIPTAVTATNFNPYLTPNPIMSLVPAEAVGTHLNVVPTSIITSHKIPRTDRLEAFPGMIPYTKRPAIEKSGLPVYQPSTTAAYQQALAMQLQQPFVPVTFAGHPPGLPRF
ncbi:hypothetical protein CHUAL_001380 [Chamberlinius hualienensis]